MQALLPLGSITCGAGGIPHTLRVREVPPLDYPVLTNTNAPPKGRGMAFVELVGIEPTSSDAETGLLRVQSI